MGKRLGKRGARSAQASPNTALSATLIPDPNLGRHGDDGDLRGINALVVAGGGVDFEAEAR
jgi:hypothetical protein